MYLVREHMKIENPEIAMAPFIEKPKKVMQRGMTTPPPPMPAIVLKAMIIGKMINPANSEPKIGKMLLWTQMLSREESVIIDDEESSGVEVEEVALHT